MYCSKIILPSKPVYCAELTIRLLYVYRALQDLYICPHLVGHPVRLYVWTLYTLLCSEWVARRFKITGLKYVNVRTIIPADFKQ